MRKQLGLASLLVVLLPLLWLYGSVFGDRSFVPFSIAQWPPVATKLSPAELADVREGQTRTSPKYS